MGLVMVVRTWSKAIWPSREVSGNDRTLASMGPVTNVETGPIVQELWHREDWTLDLRVRSRHRGTSGPEVQTCAWEIAVGDRQLTSI
jgi:hypothetical protein